VATTTKKVCRCRALLNNLECLPVVSALRKGHNNGIELVIQDIFAIRFRSARVFYVAHGAGRHSG
jgi:hypothetical protein